MVELAAKQKYSCPECGGETVWRPDKQKLVCAFCGAESPVANPPDAPRALAKYSLNAVLGERGTANVAPETAGRIAVQCQSCQAISEFEHGQVADHCQFCGAAETVPYDALADRFRPESVLPFQDRSQSGAGPVADLVSQVMTADVSLCWQALSGDDQRSDR
jgi:predicted RNA-binding Zn-ribbon protein involved in translation (DUF1610 family)